MNRDQCCLHMIALHPWLILSMITSKIKLNWFAAALSNLCIPLLISYHPLPPYFMDYLLNSLDLFLNLLSGKKLHHPLHPTKSCAIDPILTWLLKQCLDQVAPVLTVIAHTSVSCADFTPRLRGFVTPLIKELILACQIFKNYPPVSSLLSVTSCDYMDSEIYPYLNTSGHKLCKVNKPHHSFSLKLFD